MTHITGVAGSLALLAAALKAPLVAVYQIAAEIVVMVALILFISEYTTSNFVLNC